MSAFGAGWEARRAGRPLTSNHYQADNWLYWQWEAGWLSFVQTDPNKFYPDFQKEECCGV
jgi:hypothetical protein